VLFPTAVRDLHHRVDGTLVQVPNIAPRRADS
jgi:hypothetical protein